MHLPGSYLSAFPYLILFILFILCARHICPFLGFDLSPWHNSTWSQLLFVYCTSTHSNNMCFLSLLHQCSSYKSAFLSGFFEFSMTASSILVVPSPSPTSLPCLSFMIKSRWIPTSRPLRLWECNWFWLGKRNWSKLARCNWSKSAGCWLRLSVWNWSRLGNFSLRKIIWNLRVE